MGDLDNDTLTNVIKVDYSFDFDEFDEISDLAKKFISQLLQKDKRFVEKKMWEISDDDYIKRYYNVINVVM